MEVKAPLRVFYFEKNMENKHFGKLLKTNHLLPLEEEVHCVVLFEEKKIKSSAFICFLIFVV